MTLISVIVPVYNAKDYLENCVQSILSQSFTEFELLLIDDGSTDASCMICDRFALEDARVKVFHKSNGGVSSARNMGITLAKGKWIAFVDSDDVVSSDYLIHLYERVAKCKTGNQLVFGSYYVDGIVKKKLLCQTLSQTEAACYIVNYGVLALSGPYAKLFSLQIIRENSIFFPRGINMGEDGIFLQQYLNVVETISFISDIDYYVNSTEGSLSKKAYSFESEWNCFILWKKYVSEYVFKFRSYFPTPQHIIWNNRIGAVFIRCLFSVANQTPRSPLSYQLKILRSVPHREIEEFEKYYHTNSFSMKFYKYLICHRWFLLFVLIVNRKKWLWGYK